MLRTITPEEAARLLREEPGATLVDVREPDEHAREHIPGARNLPLSRLEREELAMPAGRPVLFHCRSGARTEGNAARLAAKAGPACEAGPPAGVFVGRFEGGVASLEPIENECELA